MQNQNQRPGKKRKQEPRFIYKAMKFKDITGHKAQIERLVSMVDSSRLPHALLLSGPSGIGKMQVARALVDYLNCSAREDGDSCGHCPACLQSAKLNYPDTHFIYPIIKRKSSDKPVSTDFIGEWKSFLEESPYLSPEKWLELISAGNSQPMIYVNESDEIIRHASLSAYGKGYKTFIVWQPEKMNQETANKLLKIIEEPHSDTLFIFVSDNAGALLPTIQSRLQKVEFSNLSDSEVQEVLSRHGVIDEESIAVARLAKGDLNKAFRLIQEDGEQADFRHLFVEIMRSCYARKLPELKNFSEKFTSYGREKSLRLLDYFAGMVRESFISNVGIDSLQRATPDEKLFIRKFGPFINHNNVEEISREIDRASKDIARNANQKIVWFDLFLELTRLIRTKA